MAFSLFNKKNQKEPVKATPQKEKKSSLVPVDALEEKKEEKKTPVAPQRSWRRFPLTTDSILMRPIITEKAMRMSALGKYIFEVSPSMSKILIKKAFFNAYGVMPTKIAVARQEGKEVRYGRFSGKRREVKKAIITVAKGKQVDLGI